MIVRPAAERDLDAIRAVANAYGNLDTWPRRPDYLDHELATGTLAVSEEGGEVTGFGGALARGGIVHLADLFVHPQRLGRGIGRALLDEILPPASERVTFASRDPRALPLYVGFGMSPLAPLLYMEGTAAQARALADPGLTLVEAEPAQISDLDRDASGRDRLQDLDFLRGAGARSFVVQRDGATVGYGVCRLAAPGGASTAYLGPSGVTTSADAIPTALALVRWTAGHSQKVMIPAFGPSPLVRELLDAGFFVEDVDTFMASREGLIDMRRYFPSLELG